MKLQAKSSQSLNNAFQKALKCMAAKPSIAIFENVLLYQNEHGDFYLMSSTGDACLSLPVPFTLVGGNFSSPVALPVKDIVSLLSSLPDCPVTFDIDESSYKLDMDYCISDNKGENTKSGKVSLMCMDGSNFLKMNGVSDDALHISLPAKMFHDYISAASRFISNDITRPQMQCVCIDLAEDFSELFFAASDGSALFRAVHSNDPNHGGSNFYKSGVASKILLHHQYIRVLSVFGGCSDVDVACDGNHIVVKSDDVEFICKVTENRFPNYNAIIPKGCPFVVSFDKKEFLSVVKRVSLFGSKDDGRISFSKDGMFLNVSADNFDYSQSIKDQVVVADAVCDDGFCIAFNAKKVLTCVESVESDVVCMRMSDPSRPALFHADEPSPRVLTLAMPMI